MSLKDIIDPIFARASYMSQCVLRECCRSWAEFRPPKIRDFVKARIPAVILDHIDACGGTIVGGCALACVNGDDFGDIDVMFAEDDAAGFKSVLGKIHAKILQYGQRSETEDADENKFFLSRKYELHGHIINTIEAHMSPREYLDTFDFDFCKIAITRDSLTIVHPDAVIRRRSAHLFTGDIGILFYKMTMGRRSYERVAKYTARGYEIANSDVDGIYDAHMDAITHARDILANGGGIIAATHEYIRRCKPVQDICNHMFINIDDDTNPVVFRFFHIFKGASSDDIRIIIELLPRNACRNCLASV